MINDREICVYSRRYDFLRNGLEWPTSGMVVSYERTNTCDE